VLQARPVPQSALVLQPQTPPVAKAVVLHTGASPPQPELSEQWQWLSVWPQVLLAGQSESVPQRPQMPPPVVLL
jgi:hypothetical protein